MSTQTEILEHIKSIIPPGLWRKYSHLSFGEMSEIPELAEWADEMREAENEWFLADDA